MRLDEELMKRFILTLALFVVLTLAFSSLTGCGGTQTATGNNAAKPGANTNAKTGDNTAKSTAFPPLATGLAEAEFVLLDGGKFKLSDKKGKVLLVTIWGTWCGPCIAEMPTLIELQNQYREQGLEVIGLNIGDGAGTPEPIDKITKFIAQKQLNYTIGISSNASTNEFYKITKQQVVPQSLLVDREGHLRGVFVGGGERIYQSMKETLLKTMAE